MMEDVCFDDAVEQCSTNEAKLAIDRGCGPARKVPSLSLIVRERWICVLEERDADYS